MHSDGRIAPKRVRDSHGLRRDLEISIGIPPKKWHAREPVFCFDKFFRVGKFFGLQKANSGRKFRTGYLPADGRGSDPHFGIVAQPLGLSGLGGGHHIEVSVFFAEPNGRVHGHSIFAEGRQADVAPATNLVGNLGSHAHILNAPAAASIR
jgi:hypothetical protein